jgi:hypothetical protein
MIMNRLAVASSVIACVVASGGGVAVAAGHTVGSSASQPTLGTTKVFGSYGRGWGTVKPKYLGDDTDCSGEITDIHWSSWGGASARGEGTHCTGSGAGPNEILRLAPTALKVCPGTTRKVYTRLLVQYPTGHGGYQKKQNWLGITNLCVKTNVVQYY